MRRHTIGHHYIIAQSMCIYTHTTKVFAIDSQRHFCQGTGLLAWRMRGNPIQRMGNHYLRWYLWSALGKLTAQGIALLLTEPGGVDSRPCFR